MISFKHKITNDQERESLNKLISRFEEGSGRKSVILFPKLEDDIKVVLIFKDGQVVAYMESADSYVEGERNMWGIVDEALQDNEIKKIIDIFKIEEKKEGASTLEIICDEYMKKFNEKLKEEGDLKYSTFNMIMENEDYKICDNINEEITIKKAEIEDVEDMVPIGMEAFDTSEEEERKYNLKNFKDNEKVNYIGYMGKRPVAIVSINVKGEESSVADLAVLKSERKKGIGRTLLSKSIKVSMDRGVKRFKLSVESKNGSAVKLYEQSGFKVASKADCIALNL